MQVDMNVETREAVGKGVARTLRQQGKIPGVLYGQGECISLTIDPAEIRKVLHSESGSNTLLNVHIAKGGQEIKRTTMLRDYQLDPVTGAILQADLFEIAMDKPIRVRVPVAVTRTDRKSTRLNSSHRTISYAVFCLKKKKKQIYHLQFLTSTNSNFHPDRIVLYLPAPIPLILHPLVCVPPVLCLSTILLPLLRLPTL